MSTKTYGYPNTRFPMNAVHIHAGSCVCDDCENGDSINLDGQAFDAYLAEDVANGRPIFNDTDKALSVSVTQDEWGTYSMSITEEIPVFTVMLPTYKS